MCKKYINDDIERQIGMAICSLETIMDYQDEERKSNFMSVRETRMRLLSARSRISHALRMAGNLERIRRVRPNDKKR